MSVLFWGATVLALLALRPLFAPCGFRRRGLFLRRASLPPSTLPTARVHRSD